MSEQTNTPAENQQASTASSDKKTACCSISSFMRGATDETVAPRKRPAPGADGSAINDQSLIKLTVAAEAWRFIAYCAFWGMCILAIILTRTIVVDKLAAGPDVEGDSCGPFNQEVPGLGLGFDFDLQSHLIQAFGFANICANWDYSPSREIVALFYPLFEYSLLIYLVLDFMTIALSYQRGELTKWFWTLTKIFFPIEIVLCAWFRMIFVVLAYENVAGHTVGFLGLQIALIMVAIQNSFYVLDSQVAYQFIGGLKNTRIVTIIYLICTLTISAVKVSATIYVVMYSAGAGWTKRPVGSLVAGQLVDYIWMFFNALIPLVLSFIRARSEYALDITIDMKAQKYLDDDEDDERA